MAVLVFRCAYFDSFQSRFEVIDVHQAVFERLVKKVRVQEAIRLEYALLITNLLYVAGHTFIFAHFGDIRLPFLGDGGRRAVDLH